MSAHPPTPPHVPPALQVAGLNKHFGPNRVLRDVDLEVRRGEVHGLVGGNGSGKSTLIKILAGIYHADKGGTINVNGEMSVDASDTSPGKARAAGMRFVHQDLGLYATMDVAENIALGLGFPTGRGGRIKWPALRERTAELIRRYQIAGRPTTPVGRLSPASRTLVAIARALADVEPGDHDVLILDEPTASLPKGEVDLLLGRLREFAAEGQTIIIVSHRLDEIMAVTDRVSVLHNGRAFATVDTASTTQTELAELMSGGVVEHVATPEERLEHQRGEPLLQVTNLRLLPLLDGVSFTLHRREILGIAGLAGSGRSELLLTIFGALDPATARRARVRSDAMTLGGLAYHPRTTAEAMDRGVAMVGEDRATQSVFRDWTIRKNTTLPWVGSYFRGWRLRHSEERRRVDQLMADFGVLATGDGDEMWQLSGGNQQKVVMSRWIATDPQVYLLDEPTHGVDVTARSEIHDCIRDRVHRRGAGAIVVTSHLEELADIADRVLLLHAGQIQQEISGAELHADALERILNSAGDDT